MSKVAVVFWSQTGNTEAMAKAIAEAAGAELIGAADFTVEKAATYDAIAFGCPAMGDEVLEEEEFQPMWDAVKGSLAAKKVALFGSWGWGDGAWMESWKADAAAAGITLAADPVLCMEAPDDAALEACAALGKLLAA